MKKIVYDVVAALLEKNGKVLICRRFDDDLFGSLWEFPGGKVEEGEDKKAALARELKEELGLEVEAGELINTFEDEIYAHSPHLYAPKEAQVAKEGGMKITVFLYKCSIIAGQPRCIECQDFKWALLQEMESLKLAPADKKIHTYLSKNA
ncbi:MAG: (deoxy)nucleoside triphosphate pyrophosphohydrolase [Candidatus Omnitrophica bacterium]|nr:(deoxy)nucleoside triphosphate pyrophosphohydrolase [Candidatus Omnitrophota bacterium]